MNNAIFAGIITLAAGLTMGVGALLAFFVKRENKALIAFSMGISAGAMLMVAFGGIMPEVCEQFSELFPGTRGVAQGWLLFIGGMLLMILIDRLMPSSAHHHPGSVPEIELAEGEGEKSRMVRTGTAIAVAIGIHNIPEGIATFTALLDNRSLGLMVALAVVLHNLPIGFSISMPIYAATGRRGKALWTALLSGLVSPLAALVFYLLMMPFLSPALTASMLAVVAGVMVYITVDELIPASRKMGQHHISTFGIVTGLALLALVFIFLDSF